MARTDTLGNFLTDVADAIRTKKGSEEPIAAADFDTEIKNLPSGSKGLDWNALGYDPAPDNIVEEYNYSKQIANEWDSSLTNVSNKFQNNKTLKYMPLVDTSNVTNMSSIFNGCTNLLQIPKFNISKVQNMDAAFMSCTQLTKIDFSSFETPSLASINMTFYGCTNLQTVNLDSLSFRNNGDLSYAFSGCKKLQTIDISNIDFSKVTAATWAFNNCGASLANNAKTMVYVKDQAAQDFILNLTENDRPSSWTTDNVIIAGSEADLRNA